MCPYYSTWRRMLRRCYSGLDHPAYDGCSVVDSWLSAFNFRRWMESREWEGLHLDKDILSPGNKMYSPETCAFVPQEINKLLLDRRSCRGDFPLGVSLRSNPHGWNFQKPYVAQISKSGKQTGLGYYDSPFLAHKAWQKAKVSEINECLNWYSNLRNCDRRVVIALSETRDRILSELGSDQITENF